MYARVGVGETFKAHMPSSASVIETSAFRADISSRAAAKKANAMRLQTNIKGFVGTSSGTSCDEICQDVGLKCNVGGLSMLNTCDALRESFSCTECEDNMGPDQPALEVGTGKCLMTVGSGEMAPACEAKHPNTKRLCSCE